jgi:DNA-binding transcriptional ArsR family regulator
VPADEVATLRAIAHPVRLRILSLLTGAPMSAAEVARELGLTHANASYHLRVLVAAGELVEAGEEKIRGGVAKRYRHPWDRSRPGRRRHAEQDRELYVRAMAEELVRRSRQRRKGARGVDADAELWVSSEEWDRARELVAEAARVLHAAAQPPRTPGALHVNLTAVLFEMADG